MMLRVCMVVLLVTMATGRVPDEIIDYGPCDESLYTSQYLKLAPKTNCKKFLQCVGNTQSPYIWKAMPCAPGTLFDENLQICNHKSDVRCPADIEITTPSTTPSTNVDKCSEWSKWSPCDCGGLTSRTRSCNYSDSSCPVSSLETGCCVPNCPHSCADIHRSTTSQKNGTYTIYNRNNEAYEVYCLFYRYHGYTFVPSNTTADFNVTDLFTNSNDVMIRHQRSDGSQFEAIIQQIKRFESEPLSVQYNDNKGYTWFHNSRMRPYLYLGLIPKVKIDGQRDQQGYKVNGQDQTFNNCDGNPNSYFVFLFNQNKITPTNYNVDNTYMRRWVNLASRTADRMPDRYFSFMEMHMGGCGGYTTTGIIKNVNGAALGMRYDLPIAPIPR